MVLSIDPADDARLPLVIGIAADRGLTAEAAQEAEAAVAKILAEVRGNYRATPFLLLLQLPATLRGMGDRLAQAFAADIVAMEESVALGLGPPGGTRAANLKARSEITWTNPCGAGVSPARENAGETPAPQLTVDQVTSECALGSDAGDDIACRAAFLADHCHLVIAISPSGEATAGDLVQQVLQFRLQGIPDRHTGRPLQLDKVGLGSVHHIRTGSSAGADAAATSLLLPQVETPSGNEPWDDATAWDHLDRFNADVARRLRRAHAPLAARGRPCPPLGDSWVGDRFAVADRLAVEFQQATHRTAFGLLLLGLVAAGAFQVSGAFPRDAGLHGSAWCWPMAGTCGPIGGATNTASTTTARWPKDSACRCTGMRRASRPAPPTITCGGSGASSSGFARPCGPGR